MNERFKQRIRDWLLHCLEREREREKERERERERKLTNYKQHTHLKRSW